MLNLNENKSNKNHSNIINDGNENNLNINDTYENKLGIDFDVLIKLLNFNNFSLIRMKMIRINY